MTDPSNKNEEKSLVPVPYAVIGAAWLAAVVGANSLAPDLSTIAWWSGPAVALLKFLADAQRFANIHDNPAPIDYKFHAPGVLDAIDEAIKTVPGYFDDVSIQPGFSKIKTNDSSQPLHVEFKINKSHKDGTTPESKKSTVHMWIDIQPLGNNSQLKVRFKCTGRRSELEEITRHIMNRTDELMQQRMKK